MSPKLLGTQLRTIHRVLSEKRPDLRPEFDANLTRSLARVEALDRSVAAVLSAYKGRSFFVYHPAFGYFADAYGLEQKAVETGGKKPTPRQLVALVREARKSGVSTIFVQPGFDQRAARKVASQIGGEVREFDPLDADVFVSIESLAKILAEGFAGRDGKGGRG